MVAAAAVLLLLTGIAHSYLGERYLLVRLFRRPDLPKLLGGTAFTVGTLRFAWHLTTVAWWGLALVALQAASERSAGGPTTLRIVAAVALVSGLFPLLLTRGRHLSWIVFFAVAALLFAGAARLEAPAGAAQPSAAIAAGADPGGAAEARPSP